MRNGYRRVLAATDESDQAEHAIEIACALARRAGAVFDVITVRTPALGVLLPTARAGHLAVCSAPVMELHGLPGVEIVHHAEATHADLLVLGRSDRGPAQPAMLGPTSDGVIRRRNGPTLLIPKSTRKLERVLIALDGSRRGLGVFGQGCGLARLVDGPCGVICMLPEPPEFLASDRGWVDPRRARVLELARADLEDCVPAETMIRSGDPVKGVLQAIDEWGADVIVLGVRRGGPPGELGSGHIGRDLLQAAPVAVLTVPI